MCKMLCFIHCMASSNISQASVQLWIYKQALTHRLIYSFKRSVARKPTITKTRFPCFKQGMISFFFKADIPKMDWRKKKRGWESWHQNSLIREEHLFKKRCCVPAPPFLQNETGWLVKPSSDLIHREHFINFILSFTFQEVCRSWLYLALLWFGLSLISYFVLTG